MGSTNHDLHVLFFPLMAQGHLLPMIDMAKLFASRGVDATVLTTPANASLIRPTLAGANSSSTAKHFRLHIIPFPSADSGLPEGCENLISISSDDLMPNFIKALSLFLRPFDEVLRDLRPDFVVTDFYQPWTQDVAAEHGVPRITFHGSNFFSVCAIDSLKLQPPQGDSFVLPGLPHRIEMRRSQFNDPNKTNPNMAGLAEIWKFANEVEPKSYGMVVNSFYELEPDYVEHYRKVLGRKAWHIGPVTLGSHQSPTEELWRGGGGGGCRGEECLKWLNGREPGSVVYMCFGSVAEFSDSQLREMAAGLEACGHPFIWASRNTANDWVPDGYEERIKDRGLVIRGWAPQLLILNHTAVGGFVTHCGWNSSLEGITAGLPMATWPLCAEQFYNERLLVDVLGIGVPVSSTVFGISSAGRPVVMASEVESAVRKLMGKGEEAEETRRRARDLKEMAARAVAEGGSSYNDLGSLIQEMMERKNKIFFNKKKKGILSDELAGR